MRETDSSSLKDPYAAARARGEEVRSLLIEEAGGILRLVEAAERLRETPQAVASRRQSGTILAVPLVDGEWGYPACQFTATGLLEGLDVFIAELPQTASWTRLQLLLRPADRFGQSALKLLHQGRVREAAAIAQSYEREG